LKEKYLFLAQTSFKSNAKLIMCQYRQLKASNVHNYVELCAQIGLLLC